MNFRSISSRVLKLKAHGCCLLFSVDQNTVLKVLKMFQTNFANLGKKCTSISTPPHPPAKLVPFHFYLKGFYLPGKKLSSPNVRSFAYL